MVAWEYYDKFRPVNDRFLPDCGEGENMATQTVTAVNKLIYKWYNDGDVFDNTHNTMGWANDLSGYANWLYLHFDGPVQNILLEVYDCTGEGDYEELLKELADTLLDMEDLEGLEKIPADGSIYSRNSEAPFRFEEPEDEEEDDEEYDEEDDEWY